MPTLQCPFAPQCDVVTENPDKDLAIALFNAHIAFHTAKSASRSGGGKSEKLQRPRVNQGMLEEGWSSFLIQWDIYVDGTGLQDGEKAKQLIHCCGQDLLELVLKVEPAIANKSVEDILSIVKKLAVIPVAMGVRRSELLALKQGRGEQARIFASTIQGKAATCSFTKGCGKGTCTNVVDFTDTISKYVLINGLDDADVRREALGWKELDTCSLSEAIAFVESKEMARDATDRENSENSAAHGGRSTYKKANDDPRLKQKVKCRDCSEETAKFALNRFGKIGERTYCNECWKKNHRRTPKKKDKADKDGDEGSALFMDSIEIANISSPSRPGRKAIVLNHHIFDDFTGWTQRRSAEQPTLSLRIAVEKKDYESLDLPCPRILSGVVKGVTDTGAQSCLWGLDDFYRCGFKKSDLLPVKQRMYAANRQPIDISGAIFLRLSGVGRDKKNHVAPVMVYISRDTKNLYLSKQALIALRVIPTDFPRVGSVGDQAASVEIAEKGAGSRELASCGCLKRTPTPGLPKTLPFEPSEQNITKMKNWMITRYESSTFNNCPHQELPFIEANPIRLHVDEDAIPTAISKPSYVPLHHKEKVKEKLETDVRLGVLERVPEGEPTTWLHRMVIQTKQDGEPRRTIDLSPLNKFCKREIHAGVPPAKQARAIPPKVHKSVTDAWNGFHSALIDEKDRHLTTFQTEWGNFRYRVAPQGYVSSGDGYVKRFDKVIENFQRKEKCVDDTALWDEDITTHWWRMLEFFETVGSAGIILNKNKLQFCQQTVDFAGFRITPTTVEPLPKYLNAIKSFPTPTKITDVRSWFGLVNQVAHYAKLRDLIAPLKPLLSSKTSFYWNEELQKDFEEAKIAIVEAIKNGVEIFELGRWTYLRTDYSKTGIGYFLCQKHCACKDISPDCCEDGWRVTLAGSRFLRTSERNYAPVEGECLGIAWGLEQTRYFTLGCEKLIVITDHKPITKIFGDKALDDITNPRIFSMKQRTLPWKFTPVYLPGKGNHFADAASRYPAQEDDDDMPTFRETVAALRMYGDPDDYEDVTEETIAAVFRGATQTTEAVSWEMVKEESAKDTTVQDLIKLIKGGFPEECSELQGALKQFWQFREQLWIGDDVVFKGDQILIPLALRPAILEVLGSAHQGEVAMNDRAREILFWPGITNDIRAVKRNCMACWVSAPSQPRSEPVESLIPTVPFEMIVADYFQTAGHYYLVVGDRLSDWTETMKIKVGTDEAGANGLINGLRRLWGTFGVPEVITSDGGPEFSAHATKEFLRKWNVRHHVSSAHNPEGNGRAELAVKSTKRLILENLGPNGSLDTDRYLKAILMKRNTRTPGSNLSPAEILFGKKLSDAMPKIPKHIMVMQNSTFRPQWRQGWKAKEEAMRIRYAENVERLGAKAKKLPELDPGAQVIIQNQYGSHPKKWDRTGRVVEKQGYGQYIVKVHGSGRLTRRNRQFLRAFNNNPMRGVTKTVGSQETPREPLQQPLVQPQPLDSDNGPQATSGEVTPYHEPEAAEGDVAVGQDPGLGELPEDGPLIGGTPLRQSKALSRIQDFNKKGPSELKDIVPLTEGRLTRAMKQRI